MLDVSPKCEILLSHAVAEAALTLIRRSRGSKRSHWTLCSILTAL